MITQAETLDGECGCAAPRSKDATLCCCSVDRLVHVIGRKYSMPVLNVVGTRRGARFGEVQQALDVSSSTLAETLDDLERVGLLVRRETFDPRGRGEYALTASGRALRGSLRGLLERVRTHG